MTLKAPDVTGLKKILQGFDEYQNAAFQKTATFFFALEVCGEVRELANLEKRFGATLLVQMFLKNV